MGIRHARGLRYPRAATRHRAGAARRPTWQRTWPWAPMPSLAEDVERIPRTDRNKVGGWVVRVEENLLIEVARGGTIPPRQAELAFERALSRGRGGRGALELSAALAESIPNLQLVVISPTAHMLAVSAPAALELIEDAVALI